MSNRGRSWWQTACASKTQYPGALDEPFCLAWVDSTIADAVPCTERNCQTLKTDANDQACVCLTDFVFLLSNEHGMCRSLPARRMVRKQKVSCGEFLEDAKKACQVDGLDFESVSDAFDVACIAHKLRVTLNLIFVVVLILIVLWAWRLSSFICRTCS